MIRIMFIAEAVSPIRLAQDAAINSPGTPGASAVWSTVAIAAAAIVAVCLALAVWRLTASRLCPAEERAFRSLAWRMRLGPLARREIRRAAAGSGVPAVALLLSESARQTAGLSSARVRPDPT